MIASVKNFILPECELVVIEKEDCLRFGTYLGNMQCEDTENKLFYKDLKYVDTLNKGIDELLKKCEEKVDYEEREISNNHNSFDHYRIISNCKEIIQDLKKLKGE